MSKNKFFIFIIRVSVVLAVIISMASADNGDITTGTNLFITIDPIGNHSVGEVFFINGTTNLPVSGTLKGFITTTIFVPGRRHERKDPAVFLSEIPVVATPYGANRWSVNITDDVNTELSSSWSPYFLEVQSTGNASVAAYQEFSLLPAKNIITSTVSIPASQTPVQSPSTDPPATVSVTIPPTTRSSPLSIVVLPIALLAAMVILSFSYGKNVIK